MATEIEFVTEVKGLLAERDAALDKKFLTQDQVQVIVKESEAKIIEALSAKVVNEVKDATKDLPGALERRVKELTARGPAGLPLDGAAPSLGQKFIDTPQFKAWASGSDQRAKLQLGLQGVRIREQKVAGTITQPASGYPITPLRVGHIAPATLPLGVRDLLTVTTLSGTNAIEYVIEAWNLLADYQLLEGDKKAQSDVTYTDKVAPVRTLAHYVKVSRQMLADAPYFASTVDNQLLYGLAKKEDHELLHGDNAAGHLHGILPQATALPADVIADILYSADQVAAAIAYLRSLGFTPTGIVMNPIDWASMQIAKTAQGVYILGGPPSDYAAATLWGLPVVQTSEMTPGTFLVGAFPPNATLFDRESPSVDVAYENEDDFIRNLVTMRCEERIALAVYRPQAFVKGTIPPTVVLGAQAQIAGRKKE